jgi:ribosomal protein S18 acetylase RimI-like enzyme
LDDERKEVQQMLIKKYDEAFSALIQEYQLTEQQLLYTGTPELPLKIALTNSYVHPIIGIEEKQLTNFFVLDEGKDIHLYTSNQQALLLRTFSTDARYQRRGYAKQVLQLLPVFVQEHFPEANELVLAVNQRNLPAQKLYEQSGFHYTNKLVTGPAGEQLVMSLPLYTV